MTSLNETARQCYIPVWRAVLVGWLGWDSTRFDAWVAGWFSDMVDENSLFYHEDEWYYVLPLLVPDELGNRLAKQRTKRMYNDLAHLWHQELARAIRGVPHTPSLGTPDFDWSAAKVRASAVLQTYGFDLPAPGDVSAYERRIVASGRTT